MRNMTLTQDTPTATMYAVDYRGPTQRLPGRYIATNQATGRQAKVNNYATDPRVSMPEKNHVRLSDHHTQLAAIAKLIDAETASSGWGEGRPVAGVIADYIGYAPKIGYVYAVRPA